MRKLLLLITATCFCFMVPVMAFAGNAAPKLYLELWSFAGDVPDPLPTEICSHTTAPVGGIHCYDVKTAYATAIVPIHIGNLDTPPLCPTTGPTCTTYGGFLGLPFGMSTSGEAVVFMSWVACPYFLKGPSGAGEPAACLASSYGGCRDWWDHLGYLSYVNMSTRTGTTYFDIVPSGDVAHYKVINCANEYDDNTTIGGNAQWGGTQTVTCASTGVELTTWGKIKGLFR